MLLANRMSLPLETFVGEKWHRRCWLPCYHREMRINNDFNSALLSEPGIQVSYDNYRNFRDQDNNLPFSQLPSKWSLLGSSIIFLTPDITWVSWSRIKQEVGRCDPSYWETNQKLRTSFPLDSYSIPLTRTQLHSSPTWLKKEKFYSRLVETCTHTHAYIHTHMCI